MNRYRVRQFILASAACLAAGLAVLFWRLGLAPVYAYLLGVNLTTLFLYGYDKRQAIVEGNRIPEIALHTAALLGGSPGAAFGQALFRHKTRKRRFQAVFFLIVFLQAAGLYAYWRYLRP